MDPFSLSPEVVGTTGTNLENSMCIYKRKTGDVHYSYFDRCIGTKVAFIKRTLMNLGVKNIAIFILIFACVQASIIPSITAGL